MSFWNKIEKHIKEIVKDEIKCDYFEDVGKYFKWCFNSKRRGGGYLYRYFEKKNGQLSWLHSPKELHKLPPKQLAITLTDFPDLTDEFIVEIVHYIKWYKKDLKEKKKKELQRQEEILKLLKGDKKCKKKK